MNVITSPFNKTKQHEAKRQSILSEAARLFNSKGTRATTLVDIAAQLNLTKTSLYYYVKTKEDVVYLCYQSTCDFHQSIVDRVRENGGSGREQLEALIRALFRHFHQVKLKAIPEHAVMTEIQTLKAGHRTEIVSRYKNIYLQYQAIIADGLNDDSLEHCDPVATALAVFGNLQWMVMWLMGMKTDTIEQAGENFIDIVMFGLAINPTSKSASFPPLNDIKGSKGFDRSTQNQLKQEAFYKVGIQFFNNKGFKGTSLDEIADALQVTKGAFYYHIKNKEDLLLQCFKRTLNHTRNMQIQADEKGNNGLEKLELAAHYLYYLQHSAEGPLIRYDLLKSLDRDNQLGILKQTQAVATHFGQFIQGGIDDGSIRNVDPFIAEQLITGAINSCLELQNLSTDKDLASNSKNYFKLIFRGLASR